MRKPRSREIVNDNTRNLLLGFAVKKTPNGSQYQMKNVWVANAINKCQPDFKILMNCGKCRVNIWKYRNRNVNDIADQLGEVAGNNQQKPFNEKAEE